MTKDAFSQSSGFGKGQLIKYLYIVILFIQFKMRREETEEDTSHKVQTHPAGHRIPDEYDKNWDNYYHTFCVIINTVRVSFE